MQTFDLKKSQTQRIDNKQIDARLLQKQQIKKNFQKQHQFVSLNKPSVYKLGRLSSYQKFDIKGIMRLQMFEQKRSQLNSAYFTTSVSKQNNGSRNKKRKMDMIIPCFQARDVQISSFKEYQQEKEQQKSNFFIKNIRQQKKRLSQTREVNRSNRSQNKQPSKILLDQLQHTQQNNIRKFTSKQLPLNFHDQPNKLNWNRSSSRSKSKNIQIIINKRISLNFKQTMKQYCRRMQLPQNCKIFIFQSSDCWMKEVLQQKKWVRNDDSKSQFYHLKWTNKVLHEKVKPNQFVNHFYQSDLLTSKIGLSRKVKNQEYLQQICPRSYDIGSQLKQFINDFNQTQILCGLKKIIKQVQNCNQKPIFLFKHNQLKQQFQKLITNQNYESAQNNLVIHIPYAVQICSLCEIIRCRLQKQQVGQFYKLSDKSIKNLYNFALLNPPYIIYRSQSIGKQTRQKSIKFSPDNVNLYSSSSSFRSPSQQLICLLYSYHSFLLDFFGTYKVQGTQNIWIVKNRNSSRGVGISLSNQLYDLTKKTENKLVQKYLQNSITLNLNSVNYKYDIRVWVLVTSFKPLICYYYKNFYCRLCSQQYNLCRFDCLESHLTNYSKNKDNFGKGYDKSILTYDQFVLQASHVLHKQKIETQAYIDEKMKKLIYSTLSTYQNNIESKPQCFELFGFDIFVSQNVDFYLLQVNLSPACEDRNQWLSTTARQMADSLIQIVFNHKNTQQIKQGWTVINNH